jgi:hypothetical protein
MKERLRLRDKLTYANVMVTILAVMVLGGGVAYGASQLAKNSVGTKQLKNNSVTSPKVKDHSLEGRDFKSGQLPVGATGPQGIPGTPGISGLQLVDKESAPSSENEQELTLECPGGKKLLGGGAEAGGKGLLSVALDASKPEQDGTTWFAAAHEHTATAETWFLRIRIICASVN